MGHYSHKKRHCHSKCECRELVVGSCKYPTIQSAIDKYCRQHAGCATVVIPKGVYHESLTLRKLAAAAKDDNTAINNYGLELVGDNRPLANMTYLAGGVVDILNADFGANEGRVSLANDGLNKILITVAGGDPNLSGSGYGSGDKVLVRGNDGSWNERSVVSVSGNSVQFSGAGVAVGDLGSGLVFCPCVVVSPSQDKTNLLNVAGCGVKIKGIWFKNTKATTVNVCKVNLGRVVVDNCLFDARVATAQYNVFVDQNSAFGTSTDDNLGSAITIIGGRIGLAVSGSSYLFGGTQFTTNGASVRCFDTTSGSGLVINDGSSMSVNYVQTMNCRFGIEAVIGATGRLARIFTILGSSAIGITIQRGSNIRFPSDNRYPASVIDGLGLNATQTGLQIDNLSNLSLNGNYEIRNCAVGLFDVRGSSVLLERFATLQFSGNGLDIATDATSQYGGCLLYTSPSPRDRS